MDMETFTAKRYVQRFHYVRSIRIGLEKTSKSISCRVYHWPTPVPGHLLSKPAEQGLLKVGHVRALNTASDFKNLFLSIFFSIPNRFLVITPVFLDYVTLIML